MNELGPCSWVPEVTWMRCRLCKQGMAIWDFAAHIFKHSNEEWARWPDGVVILDASLAKRGYTLERLIDEWHENFSALLQRKVES